MFEEYNKQEEKDNRNRLVGGIIESSLFKNAIKEAVKSGVYTDWGYNGEDEYAYDAFDEDMATCSVIGVIRKYLL